MQVSQRVGLHVGWSVGDKVGWSRGQSAGWSVTGLVSESVGWPSDRLVSWSVGWFVGGQWSDFFWKNTLLPINGLIIREYF